MFKTTYHMDLKEEFIKWFFENANGRYSGLTKNIVSQDLKESNKHFEKDIFDVDEGNFDEILSYLKKELYRKDNSFYTYSASVGHHRPKAILGKKNYLKFLEEKFSLNPEKHQNYWIFQGSSEIYDIEKALRAGHLKSWKLTAHKDKIKLGDKVILWKTGDKAGCYALAEVLSEVGVIEEESYEKQYYVNPNSGEKQEERVKIKITNYLADDPVLWEEIKELPEFEKFNAGNQGTNFLATKEEYEGILELTEESKTGDYWEVKKLFPEEKVEKFLSVLRNFLEKHQLDPKDERLSFNVRPNRNRLMLLIGNRYALAIDIRYGKVAYSLIHPEILSENYGKFTNHKGETEAYWNGVKTLEGIEDKIEEGFRIELDRNYKSPYRKSSNHEFIADVMQNEGELKATEINFKRKNPLNRILYGPPGTGKTYRLQDKYFEEFTVKEDALTKDQYLENIVSELTWWQTFAVALKNLGTSSTSDILKHPVVKAKERLSSAKNIHPIVWSRLQAHTVNDCPNVKVAVRSEPQIFFKENNSDWRVDKKAIELLYPEADSLISQVKDFRPDASNSISNYEFVTFHQSFGYEDFVEGIKPKMDAENSDVSYEIADGIFKNLANKAKANLDQKFALFIDEINRGNVSAIFGELITLIEEDKRMGEENEISVKLPYSKEEFVVPPNLYIFGTMNTADRSVEALDTALRRRFSFEEIMPLPHLLRNISFNSFSLEEVLKTINSRIEALLDRDHTIGHSYFIIINSGDKVALQEAFENKIIPLLQEYFYHDYEKIALILGEGFVERKEEKVQFANFSQIDDPEILPSFELKKEITDIEAVIKKLLNHKDEEAA